MNLVHIGDDYETIDEDDVVLIFVRKRDSIGQSKYAVRFEYCPPYSTENNYYTIISGKIGDEEKNEAPIDACIRELQEEAGIEILDKTIINTSFQNIPVCKSTMMRANIFIITLDESEQNFTWQEVEATGDGTVNEEKSQTQWLSMDEIVSILKSEVNCDLLFVLASFFYHSM